LDGLKHSFRTFLLSGDDQKHFDLFRKYFKNAAELLFHKKPQDKLDFIRNLQKNGHHVCMVGDGINDAGALKQADFGIAVNDDINSFSPACDAIFEGESLSKLQTVFSFSEKAIQIIIASFVISLIYNITGLGFAVSGKLTPLVAAILMPLSSVTIMIFTYTATTIAARKKGLMLWK
jgi:Cu+-exporting ATPase